MDSFYTFVIVIRISTRKTKVMLEIPAFVKEFPLSVSHTETVLIQEILITETQLHQDQIKEKIYIEYYTVLKNAKYEYVERSGKT